MVKKRKRSVADEEYEDKEELNSDSSNEDDISKDPMIKMKKAPTKPLPAIRGKANGRGRGRGKAARK